MDGAVAPKPARSGAKDDDDESIEIKLVAPRLPPKDAKSPLKSIADVAADVDGAIEHNLDLLHITPEELCDDATFLRRVSIDLTGQLPSVQEIKYFMNCPPEFRRSRKIDDLVKSPDYAERWASFWMATLLGGEREFVSNDSSSRFRQWLHEHIRYNTPYDVWVEQLLTSYGELPYFGNAYMSPQAAQLPHSPAIVYLGRHLETKGLPETVGHVTRTFLGMRMGCAQCHDHPFDKWTQEDFWKVVAFFSYTSGSEISLLDNDNRITSGTFDPPDSSLILDPALPGMARSAVPEKKDKPPAPQQGQRNYSGFPSSVPKYKVESQGQKYRKELAEWITGERNENFDRVAVNRIWQAMLGHGFVEPVDDLREKNPPTHPEALQILTEDFRNSGRDLRRLIAIVANTRAYQRSSYGPTGRERLTAVRYAARADVRPMTPEMVFCAVLKAANDGTKAKTFLEGLRHSEAYNLRRGNSDVAEFYTLLQQFHSEGEGQPGVASVEFQGTVRLALLMMHAPVIQRMLRGGGGGRPIETLFAATLCRPPTPREREDVVELKGSADDLLWVLVNCAEFVTIH